MNLGILTLIPPIIILIIAIKTKNTISSLLIGVVICCILQFKTGFIGGFVDLMYEIGMSEDFAWYALFVGLFGCILGVWSATGATRELANWLSKFATNQKRTLVLTWIIGLLIFIDDFTSIAVRGTMTKLYDSRKIPRASLSYITDAQSSPLNALIPFGTWGLFYTGVFMEFDEVKALGSSGISVYAKTIPFHFYSYTALIVSLLFCIGVLKPMGAMKKVYKRAEETGELYGAESIALNEDEEEETSEGKGLFRILIFLIPLIVFIVTVVVTGDAVLGSLYGLVCALVLTLVFRVLNWKGLMKACLQGFMDMVTMIVIVFAAYMLRTALINIGLPDYVISVAKPLMSPAMLPLITFIVCCFLAFFSGSNWGSTVPVAAIVVPLAAAIGANIPMTMAAVVSGAAFGAHACFYCDVTVFTSGMTKIDNTEHATTQLPYALIGAAAAAVFYLAAGFIVR